MAKKKPSKESLKNLIKKIISGIAGVEAEKIVDLLHGKKNVNEFLIAKKLNLTINQTRNILYKLGDRGLVRFIRKKDKKKGGWYTYFWTLEEEKSLLKLQAQILDKKNALEEQVNLKQTEKFFHCDNCDIEYDEESALLNDYTCPECGEVLKLKETSSIINSLKSEIQKLDKILDELTKEIAIIQEREGKSREKRIKREQKEKELERKRKSAERKKEREKEAKKLERKNPKKAAKKKTSKESAKKKIIKKKKSKSKKKR